MSFLDKVKKAAAPAVNAGAKAMLKVGPPSFCLPASVRVPFGEEQVCGAHGRAGLEDGHSMTR